MGACICVLNACETVARVWRETAQPEPAAGGIIVPLRPLAGSPLDRAEGHEGDVVVTVDGQAVHTTSAIQGLVRTHQAGEDVHLQIRRAAGEPQALTVTR